MSSIYTILSVFILSGNHRKMLVALMWGVTTFVRMGMYLVPPIVSNTHGGALPPLASLFF